MFHTKVVLIGKHENNVQLSQIELAMLLNVDEAAVEVPIEAKQGDSHGDFQLPRPGWSGIWTSRLLVVDLLRLCRSGNELGPRVGRPDQPNEEPGCSESGTAAVVQSLGTVVGLHSPPPHVLHVHPWPFACRKYRPCQIFLATIEEATCYTGSKTQSEI
jgi:hypothetical protein